MSSPREWASSSLPETGPALLERSVGYTRGSLRLVTSWAGTARTPCAGWDLLTLLRHLDDSVAALTDAAVVGYVDLRPVAGCPGRRPDARGVADLVRDRVSGLLAGWAHRPDPRAVSIEDRSLDSDLLAAAGALEIGVHGWDVAAACGQPRPLPEALARDLLTVLPALVDPSDRPARFAEPVDVPADADAGTRLLAALGRS